MKPTQGFVALLLHAHLPFVRKETAEVTLEERWFYEAMTDVYLPFVDMMDRLIQDKVSFRLTLSISPTLMAMIEDPLMRKRTLRHLMMLVQLAETEVLRLKGNLDFETTAQQYADRFARLHQIYLAMDFDLIAKLRGYQEMGRLEIITTAVTHAFLPLMKNKEAMRAQLTAAVEEYKRYFGRGPTGIWLPECGYTPEVEPLLQELGLRFFVVDAHAIDHAAPAEAPAASAGPAKTPLLTPSGAFAFARDPEASTLVWSADAGYPGDPDYREYYRDIGFDLGRHSQAEWDCIKPFVLANGDRIATGIKYYRITHKEESKEPYNWMLAMQKARGHAEHFLTSLTRQITEHRSISVPDNVCDGVSNSVSDEDTVPPPIFVCPYDAELFGHWWFEGPVWLETVLRGLGEEQSVLKSIAPSDYLDQGIPCSVGQLPVSSWGRGGYADVWLQPRNDWIYPQLHLAEDRLIGIANAHPDPAALDSISERLLTQAAKQLMLAQSSDWAFILDTQSVPEYAEHRCKEHVANVHLLLDHFERQTEFQQEAEAIKQLETLEKHYPLFPNFSYTAYISDSTAAKPTSSLTNHPAITQHPNRSANLAIIQQAKSNASTAAAASSSPYLKKKRVLMLSWEYPPHIIGGLAAAVGKLSKHLASQGHTVHVITCHTAESPAYEIMEDVHVHRVRVLQSLQSVPFIDWVFQMNLAFIDTIHSLSQVEGRFDLIHAHDWLVYYAAKESKETLRLPLIATIHATEYGRNQGKLHYDLGLRIHDLERRLIHESKRIITCSHAMTSEVIDIFELSMNKISMIPNGVESTGSQTSSVSGKLVESLKKEPTQQIIFFLGRLVYEKGIHILLDAMPLVLKRCPKAKLVIAGVGPMEEQLKKQAKPLGERVLFTGFVEGGSKAYLLQKANICAFPSLYEPFGIALLEAMSSGTPVVVSDTGGLAEIIAEGIDGCKVPPGDSKALALQLCELLLNPSKAAQLAARAHNKAKELYNWHTITTSTVQAYDTLLVEN